MLVDEALRYLRVFGKPDDKTLSLVEDCIDEVKLKSTPRYVKKLFSYNGKSLEGGFDLQGKSIAKFLKSSRKVAVICATLGSGIDIEIKKYQHGNIARAAVLDACASAYLEEYCDEISKVLGIEASKMNLYATHRFSPGYGDFPINTQKEILKALSAERIGVTLTEGFMLIPSKTVTALVGYSAECPADIENKCDACANENCDFRRNL